LGDDYHIAAKQKIQSIVSTIKNDVLDFHCIFILDIEFYNVYFDFVDSIKQININSNVMWMISLKNFNQHKIKNIPENNGDLKGYFWDMVNPNIHYHSKILFSMDESGNKHRQVLKIVPKNQLFKETFYFRPQNDIKDVYNCFLLHAHYINNSVNCPVFVFLNETGSNNLYQSFIELIKPVDNYAHPYHVSSSFFGSGKITLPIARLIPKIDQLVCFVRYKDNVMQQTMDLLLNQIKQKQDKIHILCMDNVLLILCSVVQCIKQLKQQHAKDTPLIYMYWMDGCDQWVSHLKHIIPKEDCDYYFDRVKWVRCENLSFQSTFKKTKKHMEPLCQVLQQVKKQSEAGIFSKSKPSIYYWDFLLSQSFSNIHSTTNKEFLVLQYEKSEWTEQATIISNPMMHLKYVPSDTIK